MDDVAKLLARIAALEATVAALERRVAERDARIVELESELHKRRKGYRPKPNAARAAKGSHDRRRRRYRKHPGVFRRPPVPDENTIHHDVHVEQCPHCGSHEVEPTGEHVDHYVQEIPEPRIELHRYRRHEYHCRDCQKRSQARGELELPGAHIGPRARLFTSYARAYLGISLEKTCTLLHDLFGLSLSRAGALGHIRWAGNLCAPVVQRLLELLRKAPVVHADETGWRINGRNVWAWCFCNPRLAVFLIDHRRSAEVLKKALGDSIPGVLVTDFYAAYNALDCHKQRCLTHLLRDLHDLREQLRASSAKTFIQTVITLFQDAIALGHRRSQLGRAAFEMQCRKIIERFDHIMLDIRPRNADCLRIKQRMFRHAGELFTFLEFPDVPADNNGGERDIRSLAAARSDGGVNRAGWSATAFANIKSVVRTCQKNALNFLEYGLKLVRATLCDRALPLPLDSS